MPTPLTVMSTNAPGSEAPNATVKMLVAAMPSEITIVPFEWRAALGPGYSVLHVHWPENLIGTNSDRTRRALKFIRLIIWNRLIGRPMVGTVHNLRPHERRGGWTRLALWMWRHATSANIYLYRSGVPAGGDRHGTVIPRGDDRPRFAAVDELEPPTLDISSVGQIRPYKRIERLIDAVRELPPAERPTVTIAGRATDPAYAEAIVARAADLDTVTVEVGFLSDPKLAELVRRSRLVVLPHGNPYNSGVALLALTLGRPVLVERTPTMRELADEVGADWVLLFDELTGEVLREALRTVEAAPPGSPDLSHRDWRVIGKRHAALYRSLLDQRHGVLQKGILRGRF